MTEEEKAEVNAGDPPVAKEESALEDGAATRTTETAVRAAMPSRKPREGGGGLTGQHLDKLKLLKDLEIPLTVEIGRTTLPVRQILDLERGAVVILDKESEEPMDIRVNGKLIARGEIVIVKESFGVRITEIRSEDGSFS